MNIQNMADIYVLTSIITSGLLCLGYLAGIVVAVLMIVRKVKLPGIFAVVGFGLFSFNLVFGLVYNLLLRQLLLENGFSPELYYPISSCFQGFVSFLGFAALIVALITGFLTKKQAEGI